MPVEKASPEEEQELRRLILCEPRGVFCATGLAEIAVDTVRMGFEDPRVAAIERLERDRDRIDNSTPCERSKCNVVLRLLVQQDKFEIIIGECSASTLRELENVSPDHCMANQWEEYMSESEADTIEAGLLYREIMDTNPPVTSRHSAGNRCPQLDCTFSAGFSIDGYPGTSGECAKQNESQPSPLVEGSNVSIKSAQQSKI